MANGGTAPPPSARRAVAVYNLARLGLFGACLGLGWLAGLRTIWLIVAALFVSGVLSWFLLARQREAMGQAVEQTVQRSRLRMAERTAREDAYADAVRSEPAAVPATPAPGAQQVAPVDKPAS